MKRINLIFAILVFAGWVNATTYLVQPGGAGASWNGVTGTVVDLSLEAKSLNEWYAAAIFNVGDEIWIIKGTYTLTDLITAQTAETIYGGFAGTEQTVGARSKGANAWDFTNETIIDGNALVRGFVSNFGALIDGLTIQNCKYIDVITNKGTAAEISNSSTLQNCIVRNNTTTGTNSAGGVFLTTNGKLLNSYIHHNSNTTTTQNGGGVFVSNVATVDGCTITYNTAGNAGGGIQIDGLTGGAVVNNSIVSNNECKTQGGGGINASNSTSFTVGAALTISNCTISSNLSKTNGGGMCIDVPNTTDWNTNPVNILNCIISNNTAPFNGGGIWLKRGMYKVDGCTINNNVSNAPNDDGTGGGGIFVFQSNGSSFTLSNSVVKANKIGANLKNAGSAFFVNVPSTVRNCLITGNFGGSILRQAVAVICTYENCTFASNLISNGTSEAGIYLGYGLTKTSTFTNCLFYKCTSNPIGYYIQTSFHPVVTYCGFDLAAVPATYANKTGCITGLTSATFTDAASGDWSLSPTSTAVDAGTTISAVTTDITGIVRPQGEGYDMGAYEYPFVSTPVNVSGLTLAASSALTITNGGHLIVDVPTTLNSITVERGGKLTNNSGQTLTVTNLTINSDATGTGTFVDLNATGGLTINGTASVQQYLTGKTGTSTRAYWYLSSPVSAATSGVFNVAGLTNKLTYYNETVPCYATQISTNATTLTKGVGYVAYIGGADATYTFSTSTGTATTKLNTGAITLTPTRTGTTAAKRGFNLVGNPYPSFLDWNAVTKTNVRPTIWYRTYTGSVMQFDTFDGTNGTSIGANGLVSQYIPPMQAFWVKVTADDLTGSLVLNNSMRSHQDQSLSNRLRVPSITNPQVLRLKVSNGVNGDETLVVTNSNATDGYDGYDSPKMTNDNEAIPEIYTLADSEEIVINNLNSIGINKELTLGFRTGASNSFTIKATQVSNFDVDTKIILKDNMLNTEQDITNGSAYSFTSDVVNTSPFQYTIQIYFCYYRN